MPIGVSDSNGTILVAKESCTQVPISRLMSTLTWRGCWLKWLSDRLSHRRRDAPGLKGSGPASG